MQAHHHQHHLLLLLLLLSPVLAVPLPQEGLDPAPPVILLQPTSFENVFAEFPDFGQFERFPSFAGFANVDIPHPPQIELKDIFGANKEQPLNPAGDCGLICKVFKNLEGQLGVFQDDEGVVRAPVSSEQGDSQGKYDNQTESFEEKVLADGSVLRINKTLIHDTDEEGNGFFFQSSVHHIIKEDEEEIEDENVENADEIQDEIEDSAEEVEDESEDNAEEIEDDEEELGLDEEDPTLNEVFDEKFPTSSVEDLELPPRPGFSKGPDALVNRNNKSV